MNSNMAFIIFAWIFFLICGGIMMLGTYLIFGRKQPNREEKDPSAKKSDKLSTVH